MSLIFLNTVIIRTYLLESYRCGGDYNNNLSGTHVYNWGEMSKVTLREKGDASADRLPVPFGKTRRYPAAYINKSTRKPARQNSDWLGRIDSLQWFSGPNRRHMDNRPANYNTASRTRDYVTSLTLRVDVIFCWRDVILLSANISKTVVFRVNATSALSFSHPRNSKWTRVFYMFKTDGVW